MINDELYVKSTRLTFKKLLRDGFVDIIKPIFTLTGLRNFPVGPHACQVNANASHDGRFVLKAKSRKVKTVVATRYGHIGYQCGKSVCQLC